MQIVVDELKAVQEKFGDERRTEIIEAEGEFRDRGPDRRRGRRDHGQRHRLHQAHGRSPTYRSQRRGGKGRIGMRTREEDFVDHLFVASTHCYIMIFSDRGRALLAEGPRDPGRRGRPARARRSPTSCRWSRTRRSPRCSPSGSSTTTSSSS